MSCRIRVWVKIELSFSIPFRVNVRFCVFSFYKVVHFVLLKTWNRAFDCTNVIGYSLLKGSWLRGWQLICTKTPEGISLNLLTPRLKDWGQGCCWAGRAPPQDQGRHWLSRRVWSPGRSTLATVSGGCYTGSPPLRHLARATQQHHGYLSIFLQGKRSFQRSWLLAKFGICMS